MAQQHRSFVCLSDKTSERWANGLVPWCVPVEQHKDVVLIKAHGLGRCGVVGGWEATPERELTSPNIPFLAFFWVHDLFFMVGYGCFQKLGHPQIIHFSRVFHYKPSILGYPYFWKHPYVIVSWRVVSVCLYCFYASKFCIMMYSTKKTCPLKNNAWKTILSFWNAPFEGTLVSFSGV